MEGYHESVLLREVLENLQIEPGGWYLDCTLGDGGYSLEILKRGGKVAALDVDPQALERSKKRLEDKDFGEQDFLLILGNFRDLENLLKKQAETQNLRFRGVVFDLGVSSLQLEAPQRGFSFSKVGPLDMRMDPGLQVKALDLINGLNKGELNELFTKLGEEKFARRIADTIVSTRQVKSIESTHDLADLIARTTGQQGKIHPATRIFQALRIAVNDELEALREALPQVLERTNKDGHILIVSFHSLEDRIIKNIFKNWQTLGLGRIITKKPIMPTEEEKRENPRSRSAKLRVFEKKL